jgi:hypothetical protein
LAVIEEHAGGKQYVRLQLWPIAKPGIFLVACCFAAFAMRAALDLEWTAWALLNVPAIFLVARTLYESAGAMAALREVIEGKPGVASELLATEIPSNPKPQFKEVPAEARLG